MEKKKKSLNTKSARKVPSLFKVDNWFRDNNSCCTKGKPIYLANALKTGLDYDCSHHQNQEMCINVFVCFNCYPYHHMYIPKTHLCSDLVISETGSC